MKTKGILAILLVTTSGAVFSPEVVQGTIVEFHDEPTIRARLICLMGRCYGYTLKIQAGYVCMGVR